VEGAAGIVVEISVVAVALKEKSESFGCFRELACASF
jgi:hypothetical protein